MAKARSSDETPTFEQAMQQLEATVRALEDASLPLEEMITRYEAGTALLKICQRQLDAAQQRIEIINRRASGEPVVEPFAPAAVVVEVAAARPPEPAPSRRAPAPPDHADEIRLF